MMTMNDKEYVAKFGSITITFYPLTAKHIRTMPEEMKALVGMRRVEGQPPVDPFAPARFEKLCKLWLASAQRGDKNVTKEMIEDVVDFRNMTKINKALLGQDWEENEFVTQPSDGEQTPMSPLIGGSSTQG
jgi:hypothetical protein